FVAVEGKVWVNRTVGTIVSEAGAAHAASDSMKQPDIVAVTALSASLQAGHQWRDIHRTGLMLVDLKNPASRINDSDKTKAWDYARELIRGGMITDGMPVDIFVIGGEVDEDFGAPRVEGWSQNIRIIACSYDQLIARAKRLTMDLKRILEATPEVYDDRRHTQAMASGHDHDHDHDDDHDDHHDGHGKKKKGQGHDDHHHHVNTAAADPKKKKGEH
ncbi:MAG TPA: hypothetical protein DCL54_09270, partial [Alphaproteobacteria bacterium]|nr:hypothetical protein [Alphaproteobacteria bacterium]